MISALSFFVIFLKECFPHLEIRNQWCPTAIALPIIIVPAVVPRIVHTTRISWGATAWVQLAKMICIDPS